MVSNVEEVHEKAIYALVSLTLFVLSTNFSILIGPQRNSKSSADINKSLTKAKEITRKQKNKNELWRQESDKQ